MLNSHHLNNGRDPDDHHHNSSLPQLSSRSNLSGQQIGAVKPLHLGSLLTNSPSVDARESRDSVVDQSSIAPISACKSNYLSIHSNLTYLTYKRLYLPLLPPLLHPVYLNNIHLHTVHLPGPRQHNTHVLQARHCLLAVETHSSVAQHFKDGTYYHLRQILLHQLRRLAIRVRIDV
jgi:hypothetical protein